MAKRVLVAVLFTLVLLAGGFVLQRQLLAWSSAPAASTAPLDSTTPNAGSLERTLATVIEIEGIAEHRSPGGAWHPLGVGAAVDINDEVRTAPDSRARLHLGDQVTVGLAENTGINVAQLSQTLSRILLQDGRVVSEVRERAGFVFRVQVQGSNAEAESSAGRFFVLKRGGVPATFASEQGRLLVRGAGESVTLEAGEQTVVANGSAPSPPAKLPASLLLKLGSPPPSRTRSRQLRIKGETSPGAVVSIREQLVAPDSNGQFSSTVTLVDGPNEILVQVEDVAGRKQSTKLPKVTLDASAPGVAGKVVW